MEAAKIDSGSPLLGSSWNVESRLAVYASADPAVDRVSGYDLWRADDLTMLARPVIWSGQVAKVSVVTVPYRDRSVLLPQFANGAFERISHAHQVL